MNVIRKNWLWTTVSVLLVVAAMSCEEVPEIPPDAIPDIPVPTDLSAFLSEDGVTLSWEYDTNYDYSGFNVLRSEDDQITWVKQATVAGPPYVDSNLRTGFTYWYAVAGVDQNGIQGEQSAPFPARPALFAVIIQGGAPYTSTRDVLLTFTAPSLTQNVRFSEDSTFSDTQWRDFAPSYPMQLSVGDGGKVVWGQFRDEAGSLTQPVKSSIILDTFCQIDSLMFSRFSPPPPPVDTIPPGATVRFRIVPAGNETGGFAEVYIEGMGSTPVEVYDDGRNGDSEADDGSYERNYQFALSFRQRSMRMSAVFLDAAGNASVEREFEDNMYMSDPPDAVTLLAITETTSDSITIRWTRDQATTVFTDTDLAAGQRYYYKVYVVNDLDEGTPSNEEWGETTP
jgi:hypothetical protein